MRMIKDAVDIIGGLFIFVIGFAILSAFVKILSFNWSSFFYALFVVIIAIVIIRVVIDL
jgi:hypothetical protein